MTLFAALNYLDGKIFGLTAPEHTHHQWLSFLNKLDRETPADLTLHLIADNYSTHKHAKVKSWVQWRNVRHHRAHGADRIDIHFTQTYSSWMNLVERFFRDLTEDAIRPGSFQSELVASTGTSPPNVTYGEPPVLRSWRRSSAPEPHSPQPHKRTAN